MSIQGPFKRFGALSAARKTTLQSLQKMFDKADKELLRFRCKWTGQMFTPKQLLKELKQGRWIRTPECWHLIDRNDRRVA